MKRQVLSMVLALLLALSLSACGSYRNMDGMDNRSVTDNGTTGTNGSRTNGRTNGDAYTDGTAGNGTVGNTGTDMMPDPEDGYVDDNNADDGVVDAKNPAPSPKVSTRP